MHYLKTVLTRPLRERGADGAEECVDMLEEYGLSRDDLFEVGPVLILGVVVTTDVVVVVAAAFALFSVVSF